MSLVQELPNWNPPGLRLGRNVWEVKATVNSESAWELTLSNSTFGSYGVLVDSKVSERLNPYIIFVLLSSAWAETAGPGHVTRMGFAPSSPEESTTCSEEPRKNGTDLLHLLVVEKSAIHGNTECRLVLAPVTVVRCSTTPDPRPMPIPSEEIMALKSTVSQMQTVTSQYQGYCSGHTISIDQLRTDGEAMDAEIKKVDKAVTVLQESFTGSLDKFKADIKRDMGLLKPMLRMSTTHATTNGTFINWNETVLCTSTHFRVEDEGTSVVILVPAVYQITVHYTTTTNANGQNTAHTEIQIADTVVARHYHGRNTNYVHSEQFDYTANIPANQKVKVRFFNNNALNGEKEANWLYIQYLGQNP
ncbi:hypothetical protein Pelo_8090 [Pelomyxa schiedti]|nr:hypothetical protein Pelo_8090 [Pelomyxa schiedti]